LMPWLILSPQTAIGTGRDYALAAMHCGSTAAEAVAIAALFDPGTGGGVDTVTLTLEIDHGR
jgi:ATP-dependent protease HslVU (ClpYQ) peptidase subunit